MRFGQDKLRLSPSVYNNQDGKPDVSRLIEALQLGEDAHRVVVGVGGS